MKNITFVLGAGASVDYGLPTAAGLKNQIINFLKSSNFKKLPLSHKKLGRLIIPNNCNASSFPDIELLLNVADRITRSLPYQDSIDVYNFEQSGYHEPDPRMYELISTISKIATSHEICGGMYKAVEDLKNNNQQIGGWIPDLVKKMGATRNFEELEKLLSRVKIITFNYDTLFGNLLYLVSAQKLGKSLQDENLKKTFRSLEIVHVYGQLSGYLFDERLDDATEAIWINKIAPTTDVLIKSYDRLKFYHESSESIKTAKNLMNQSKEIIFFGFGFNSQNLEAISPSVKFEGLRKMYFSRYGKSDDDVVKIKESIVSNFIAGGYSYAFISDYIKHNSTKDLNLFNQYDFELRSIFREILINP